VPALFAPPHATRNVLAATTLAVKREREIEARRDKRM
jgi:hypothetical protein